MTTIILSCACLNISFNLTVFITSESIRSFNTFPAPTEGNWSLSPTIKSLVPDFIALSKLYISTTSTIETSSRITTSASIGSSSFFINVSSSLSIPNPISKSLWIVFASLFEVSLILFAARPVGAAKTTFWSLFSNTLIIVLIVVVFPVPGPAVIITTPFSIASLTAITWFCASLIPSSLSINFISWSTSMFKFSKSYCASLIISLQTPFSER